MKKINLKDERAAVSSLILFTVFIFATILVGTYVVVATKAKSQIMSDAEIQKIYGAEVDRADEIYDEVIAKNKLNVWVYDHERQIVAKGTTILNIGDYIKYDEPEEKGYSGRWQILGADQSGHLLLVSSQNLSSTGTTLSGANGYNNGVTTLNSVCEGYVNENDAISARSINVDDIDKITGYNPEHTGVNDQKGIATTGSPYGNGEVGQYGNKVIYSILDGYVNYKLEGESSYTKTTYTTYKLPGEANNITLPHELESTAYWYYPTTLTETKDDNSTVGIGKNTRIWEMLFSGTSNESNYYWLASPTIKAGEGFTAWRMRYINNEHLDDANMSVSYTTSNPRTYGVRAVITMKHDFTPIIDN